MSLGAWMRANLTTQGYCLADEERRELAIGLRFSTGLCLALVVVALVLQSAAMLFALCGVALIAAFTARHPFDYLWNHVVRRASGAPPLPPNPARRRDAFKVGTVWLAVVGTLFAVGAMTAAIVLGGMLVAACTTVTALNLCLPSEAFALWERRARRREATHACPSQGGDPRMSQVLAAGQPVGGLRG
jgi:Domain of unknown function (DUF4395)